MSYIIKTAGNIASVQALLDANYNKRFHEFRIFPHQRRIIKITIKL